MAKTRPPYTAEFRRQMVELVRAGRSPEELAQEFEPTAQSIRNWVGQAECDAGRGGNGLTTAEREELTQLRRENRQLRLERDILSIRQSGVTKSATVPTAGRRRVRPPGLRSGAEAGHPASNQGSDSNSNLTLDDRSVGFLKRIVTV